jgi:hypothetical protein
MPSSPDRAAPALRMPSELVCETADHGRAQRRLEPKIRGLLGFKSPRALGIIVSSLHSRGEGVAVADAPPFVSCAPATARFSIEGPPWLTYVATDSRGCWCSNKVALAGNQVM